MEGEASKQISNSDRHGESSRSNIDLLSQLPYDLLIEIICLLSTKEAVRTSVLNKRWRNLWKQIRNINFSFKETEEDSLIKEFDAFDNFLRNLNPSITKNKFRVQFYCNPTDTLDSYLSWAVEGRVKMLALDIKIPLYVDPKLYQVPAFLFQCQFLVELELSNVALLNVHNASWPLLKGLNLSGTKLNAMDFSNLMESCPLLERLSLVGCDFYSYNKQRPQIRICSTTVRCLKFWKCLVAYDSDVVLNLPSLVQISIEKCIALAEAKERALLDAANYVEKVHVGHRYMQVMCKNGIKKSATVKHVQVEITIYDNKCLEGVAYMISSYSNLQSLVVMFNYKDRFIEVDNFQRVLDGVKVLEDCLLGMLNLKTIHVCGINASEVMGLRKSTINRMDRLAEFHSDTKFKIVRILLEKLVHLEELTIYVEAKGYSNFGSESHLVEETRKLFEISSPRSTLQVTCEPYDCLDWSAIQDN